MPSGIGAVMSLHRQHAEHEKRRYRGMVAVPPCLLTPGARHPLNTFRPFWPRAAPGQHLGHSSSVLEAFANAHDDVGREAVFHSTVGQPRPHKLASLEEASIAKGVSWVRHARPPRLTGKQRIKQLQSELDALKSPAPIASPWGVRVLEPPTLHRLKRSRVHDAYRSEHWTAPLSLGLYSELVYSDHVLGSSNCEAISEFAANNGLPYGLPGRATI